VLVAEWPVRLVGGLPVVEGAINGHAMGILIDTGASRSMILKVASDRLALPRHATGNRIYGVGGISAAEMVLIDEMRIEKMTRKNWRVLAVGERDLGRNIGFILGADFFERVDMEIDYAAGVVRLFDPQGCHTTPLAYWAKDGAGVIEIDRDTTIRFHVLVNARPVYAMLDTGASTSILDLSVAHGLGVAPGGPGVVEGGCASGIGANLIERWVGPFESFSIGDETVRSPKLMISNFWKYTTALEIGSRIPRGPVGRPSMLIGTDFLRTHRVYVARSQRKLYFTYTGGLVFPSVPKGDCGRPQS
jgi:predicted aspartyl protease